ncbi:DUF2142 domain-containing protein [Lachnospiraceae bacterium ZAX-1]
MRSQYHFIIQRIKGQGKAAFVIPLIFVLFTSILVLCNLKNAPRDIKNFVIAGDRMELGDPTKISGYAINQGEYIPKKDAVRANYKDVHQDVSCVELSFDMPMAQDTAIHLQYKEFNQEKFNGNVAVATMEKGDQTVTFVIPKRMYQEFAVEVFGSFTALKVQISDSYDAVYQEKGLLKRLLPVLLYALVLDILFLAGWLCFLLGNRLKKVTVNIKKIGRSMGIVSLATILSILLEVVFSYIRGTGFIGYRWVFIESVLLILLALVKYRGDAAKLFLAISLLAGLMMAIVFPISLVAWDEETHYPLAVAQSFVKSVHTTKAEEDIRSIAIEDYYDATIRPERLSEKNTQYDIGYHRVSEKTWKDIFKLYSRIGHVPAGIFLFIGRSLNFPFSFLFLFGRFANVLVYSLIVSIAIKKLKTGKYIMATIALFPTSMFLASNYSYDYWVNAFLYLALAYFFNELCQPQEKAQEKDLAIMVIAFFLALGPKPIYFPLMAILYFVGKNKFKSRKAYRMYGMLVTFAIVLVVLSFLLPFVVTSGSGISDARGGSDVNAILQTKFILNHPFEYALTMWRFCGEYFSMIRLSDAATAFAHLGRAPFFMLIVVVLCFVTFTDRNKFDVHSTKIQIKGYVFLACAVAMALVFTSLYIAFTPVGLDTINGVQSRYLMPTIFPFLLVAGSGKIKSTMSSILYSELVFGTMSFVLLYGVWKLCVSLYH